MLSVNEMGLTSLSQVILLQTFLDSLHVILWLLKTRDSPVRNVRQCLVWAMATKRCELVLRRDDQKNRL